MLQNDYFVVKIGVDTAENGPSKVDGNNDSRGRDSDGAQRSRWLANKSVVESRVDSLIGRRLFLQAEEEGRERGLWIQSWYGAA